MNGVKLTHGLQQARGFKALSKAARGKTSYGPTGLMGLTVVGLTGLTAQARPMHPLHPLGMQGMHGMQGRFGVSLNRSAFRWPGRIKGNLQPGGRRSVWHFRCMRIFAHFSGNRCAVPDLFSKDAARRPATVASPPCSI